MQFSGDPAGADFRDAASCDLVQAMPWASYQGVNLQALSAIYAYLRALPHEEPTGNTQCTP
jgi:hypothetical protein